MELVCRDCVATVSDNARCSLANFFWFVCPLMPVNRDTFAASCSLCQLHHDLVSANETPISGLAGESEIPFRTVKPDTGIVRAMQC